MINTPRKPAPKGELEARNVLRTVRDYVADAASGRLSYEDSADGFAAMAKDDLSRIDAVLATVTTTPEQAVIQADFDCFKAIFGFGEEIIDPEGDDKRALELLAAHRLAAEEQAWREARVLARGTNADLCNGGAGQAYRLICEALSNAVNNPKLRTLAGRVENIVAARKAQPLTEPQRQSWVDQTGEHPDHMPDLTEPQRLGQEGEAWERCGIGSCKRHQECMYTPCRTAALTPAQAEPVADDELARGKDELRRLMDAIWRSEFRKTAPNWKPLDDLPGMVSQIDNMYAGVRAQRDQARWDLHNPPPPAQAEPVAFISAGQLEAITDRDDDGGTYLPVRKAARGNFRTPLFAHPPAPPQPEYGRIHTDGSRSGGQPPQDREAFEDRLEDALTTEIDDVEIEDALVSEGIHVWGPDGERFQRMFAVVMKLRRKRIERADAELIGGGDG